MCSCCAWLCFSGELAKGVWAYQSRLPRVAAVQQEARPQEAKHSVYRVLAGVVSERAAGLLLFRRHFLILVTRTHETLREEASMTNWNIFFWWRGEISSCFAASLFDGYISPVYQQSIFLKTRSLKYGGKSQNWLFSENDFFLNYLLFESLLLLNKLFICKL